MVTLRLPVVIQIGRGAQGIGQLDAAKLAKVMIDAASVTFVDEHVPIHVIEIAFQTGVPLILGDLLLEAAVGFDHAPAHANHGFVHQRSAVRRVVGVHSLLR